MQYLQYGLDRIQSAQPLQVRHLYHYEQSQLNGRRVCVRHLDGALLPGLLRYGHPWN